MNKAKTPIVITGATGFLGKYLTDEFIRQGYEVYALTRDTQKARSLFKGSNLTIIEASIAQRDTLSLPPYARIFHCAAITGSIQSKRSEYEQVNVQGTLNLLDAAIQANAQSFTFVSSVSAVGAMGSVDKPITENTPPQPGTFYGISKALAENRILSLAPKEMSVTIVRPSLIYGAGQRTTSGAGLLFNLCQKETIPLIGNAHALIPMVYVNNVVSALIDLSFSHQGHEVFNVSDLEPYSLKKLAQIIHGREDQKYLPIPHSMTYPLSLISDGISQMLGKDFGVRSELIKALSRNGFVMSIDKALQFGYQPTPTDEVIRDLATQANFT